MSKSCQHVDTDLDLAGGAGQILGFLPDFEAFCAELSRGVTRPVNRVECECDNRGSGNFDIHCWSNGDSNAFSNTATTLTIADGVMDEVKTCSILNNANRTSQCTTVKLFNSNENNNGSIESCSETWNGQECESCVVCNQGQGIRANCSNFDGGIVDEQCRVGASDRLFEILPASIQQHSPPQLSSGSADGIRTRNQFGTALYGIGLAVVFWMM